MMTLPILYTKIDETQNKTETTTTAFPLSQSWGGGGGRGTPIYELYRYVPL